MKQSFCVLALLAAPLFAQTERGNITGQVKDPSGAAIGGAEVTATYVTTNVQARTVTTGAGEYNLPAAPGLYHVVISAAGFKRYVRDNVTVPAATTVRLDSTLELGSVNESVEVTADVTLLQSETVNLSEIAMVRI